MRAEFEQAISTAAQQEDPQGIIDSVKQAVVREIRSADPTVAVTLTDYFNHTIVPDMVLRWPGQRRERLLYIRPNPSIEWLANGLRHIAMHKPMVFTLEDLQPGESPEGLGVRERLDRIAKDTGTWIIDPSGIAELAQARNRQPDIRWLARSLVRGGRGVVGPSEVSSLTAVIVAGFLSSASPFDPAKRQATDALEDSLSVEESDYVISMMSTVSENQKIRIQEGARSARQQRSKDFNRTEEEKLPAIEKRIGGRSDAAISYQELGSAAQVSGDLSAAEEWLRKSLAISEELGDRRRIAPIYDQLGMVAQVSGDLSAAEEWLRKSLAISEELGDRRRIARIYHQLGMMAQVSGELARAQGWYRRSLAVARELGDRILMGRAKTAAETADGQNAVLAAWRKANSHLLQSQDALITATLLQNVQPLLSSLHSTKDAVVRAGPLLIVKIDWTVQVHQLTAAQQATLDHNPALMKSPGEIITVLALGESEIGDSGVQSSNRGGQADASE